MPIHLLVKWEVVSLNTVVDKDSENLQSVCPLYPLFPCCNFLSQMWGWFGGGGGIMFYSYNVLLFPTFQEEEKIGN